jgi:hypothetical protein
VYSNNPNQLWVASRIQPIHFAPRDIGIRGTKVNGQLEEFTREIACSSVPTYLAFYLVTDERYLSLAELKDAVTVKKLSSQPDGVLLQVTPKQPQSCTTSAPDQVRRG